MRVVPSPVFVAVISHRGTDARGKASPVLIPILNLDRGYGWHKYEDVSSPMAESLSQSEDDYIVNFISCWPAVVLVHVQDLSRPTSTSNARPIGTISS